MNNSNLKTESINGVILRLLKIEPGTELDYETYFVKLRTKLILANAVKTTLPAEENKLLRDELARVKKIKDKGSRFKVKNVKVSGKSNVPPPSPSRSSSPSPSSQQKNRNKKTLPPSSEIVKYEGGQLTRVSKEEKEKKKEEKEGTFTDIKKTLDSILKTLSSKFKFERKEADQERKDRETERRSKKESLLEGFAKGVGGIVSATKKLLSPFEGIMDRINRFILFTLLGKAFNSFMDWMSNKENKKKFDNFVDFLIKHWPALAGLYILFGTSFGKLVRGLLKGAVKLTFALVKGIPRLISFIRKNKKLAFLALAAGSLLTGPAGKQIRDMISNKGDTPETDALSDSNPELDGTRKTIDQLRSSQGSQLSPGSPSASSGPGISIPKANTGGIIPAFKFGGMNKLNPFGGPGAGLYSGIPITGAGPDDTLIAAKTGEAVLTEKDQEDIQRKYGLNIPQYLAGRKPGYVNTNNIKPLGGFGGAFSSGGMIQKFNNGGLVGGFSPSISIPSSNMMQSDNLAGGSSNLSINPSINSSNMQGGGPSIGSNLSINPNINLSGNRQSGNLIAMQSGGSVSGSTGSGKTGSTSAGAGTPVLNLGRIISGDPGMQLHPTLSKSIPLLFRMLQSGRFKNKGWGSKKFLDQLLARLLVESSNFGRATEMYEDVPGQPDPKGKEGFNYFSRKYNNRSDLGNRLPTDGYTFRGRGAIQLTGRAHYEKFNQWLVKNGYGGIDVVKNPNILATDPKIQALSVLYYLEDRERTFGTSFADIANRGDTDSFVYNINGNYNHLAETKNNLRRIQQLSGGVNYGTGFSPRQPKPKPTPTSWIDRLNPMNWFNGTNGKKHGGLIDGNTGLNILGATNDTQLTRLQKGEYVLPKETVDTLGLSLIERVVAMTDKGSEAFLKRGSLNLPEITPPISGRGEFINLPPIDISPGGSMLPKSSGGSSVPSFSAVSPVNDREKNAKMYYGIG